MKNYTYPGFDRLEDDSPIKLALPLCDILRSFIGEKDFSYISSAIFPLEMTKLILHYLKYQKGVDCSYFEQKYLTEDTLCRIDDLMILWGADKFDQMISELEKLAKI